MSRRDRRIQKAKERRVAKMQRDVDHHRGVLDGMVADVDRAESDLKRLKAELGDLVMEDDSLAGVVRRVADELAETLRGARVPFSRAADGGVLLESLADLTKARTAQRRGLAMLRSDLLAKYAGTREAQNLPSIVENIIEAVVHRSVRLRDEEPTDDPHVDLIVKTVEMHIALLDEATEIMRRHGGEGTVAHDARSRAQMVDWLERVPRLLRNPKFPRAKAAEIVADIEKTVTLVRRYVNEARTLDGRPPLAEDLASPEFVAMVERAVRDDIHSLRVAHDVLVANNVTRTIEDSAVPEVIEHLEQGLVHLRSEGPSPEKRVQVMEELERSMVLVRDYVNVARKYEGLPPLPESPLKAFVKKSTVAPATAESVHTLDESTLTTEEKREVLRELASGKVPLGMRGALAGLTDDWTDQALMRLGGDLWKAAWKSRVDDASAENEIETLIRRTYAPAHAAKRAMAVDLAMFAGWWAHCAFQKMVTTHTYAAALMASDATRDVMSDIELHWRAFMVVVPDGLLEVEEDGVELDYTRILVCVKSDGAASIAIYAPSGPSSHEFKQLSHSGASLPELLQGDPAGFHGSKGIDDTTEAMKRPSQRALRLAKRLVAGLLLAMQHADNFKTKDVPARVGKRNERDEPAHRVVFVGKAIKVDCRPAVRAWLTTGKSRKGHGAPTVQVLVRGHYKRQVMGVGRKGRKVIWIEPYWKGPEDAPILTRPKHIGGTAKEAS